MIVRLHPINPERMQENPGHNSQRDAKVGRPGRYGLEQQHPLRQDREIPKPTKLDPDGRVVIWWQDQIEALQKAAVDCQDKAA